MKKLGIITALLLVVCLFISLATGCSQPKKDEAGQPGTAESGEKAVEPSGDKAPAADETGKDDTKPEDEGDKGSVKIDGPGGSVNVTGDGEKGAVKITGPDGQVVNIEGDKGSGTVNIKGPGGKTINISGNGDTGEVKVEGPDGTVTTKTDKKIDESKFSVKFYPGAEVLEGSSSVVESEGKKIHGAVAKLETKDDVEKVKNFYKEQFTTPVVTEAEGIVNIMSGPAGMDQGGKQTIVTIKKGEKDGTTEIIINSHDLDE